MKRMKPSKKRAAKRKYTDLQQMLIDKLINLKYRINDAYRSGKLESTKNDKSWVIARIRDIRDGMTLTKGEMLHCNNLWKDYSKSKMNDWVSYKND